MAILVRYVRDFDLAEDMLQEACLAALEGWPVKGIPHNPPGWLLQTARRKTIDRLRRDANFQEKLAVYTTLREIDSQSGSKGEDDLEETIPDERLRLVFTCCHPALEEHSRVALTLRTLGGLSTPEIARAFLVSETTMAQRLVRAKRKIKAANIPYIVPPPHAWPERLDSVLSVVYLIFNEGYAPMTGDTLTRADLCREAIRLGHILVHLVPQESEVAGLLALMVLHDARHPARMDQFDRFVPLEKQNRTLWNRDQIERGKRILLQALALGRPGPYQIQAAISAVHAQADTYEATDWKEIALLYEKLYELEPSPVVKLNSAVALSFAHGAEVGLRALEQLPNKDALAQYQPFHAAHADFLRRLGRYQEAAVAYRRALELTENKTAYRFLKTRLQDVTKAICNP